MTTTTPPLNAGDFSIVVSDDETGRTETITLGRLVVTRKHGSVISFIDARGIGRCRRQSSDLIEFLDAMVAGSGLNVVTETVHTESSGKAADKLSRANLRKASGSL